MQIVLGTDIRTKENIPNQDYDVKLNVGVDEVVIVSENNEIETFKSVENGFFTYENKLLIKTCKKIYSVEVTNEIKQRYKEKNNYISHH